MLINYFKQDTHSSSSRLCTSYMTREFIKRILQTYTTQPHQPFNHFPPFPNISREQRPKRMTIIFKHSSAEVWIICCWKSEAVLFMPAAALLPFYRVHLECGISWNYLDIILCRLVSFINKRTACRQNSMLKMASFFSQIDELQNHFKTHNKTREYQAHSSKVHSVGWSCDGRRLASGSFDKSVTIFTLERDRLVWATLTSFRLLTIIFFKPEPHALALRGPEREVNHSFPSSAKLYECMELYLHTSDWWSA